MHTQQQQPLNERVSWEALHDQIVTVKSNVSFRELVAASSENIVILNTHMQIVFVTRRCMDLFEIDDPAEVYGCRLGEAMRCIHAEHGGCGTSKHCVFCGAANAISASLSGEAKSTAYSVAQKHTGERLNLTVHTKPITLKGEHYILLSLSESDV